mmetsp:Transcript_29318/g.32902  ORF Transcript_29318/g.32902 Transcript_29318/m.32902 type:complete len:154 (+) Transcript_29318:70-531(+)
MMSATVFNKTIKRRLPLLVVLRNANVKRVEGVDKTTKAGNKGQRLVTMRNNNNKVVLVISPTEGTTKTIDDEIDEDSYDNDANKKVFPPKKQKLCAKEHWNRFQAATRKKIKESAKEMELLHRTQPQYYIGAFGVKATPPSYSSSYNPQGHCY